MANRHLMRDIALAMDPNTPPEMLPWRPGPYAPEVRAAGIQVVKEFHALALYNSLRECKLPFNNQVVAKAVKRILTVVDRVIEEMSDHDIGRLVFFDQAYQAIIDANPSSLIAKIMTMDDNGYYEMPKGIARQILGLFPDQEILKNLMASIVTELDEAVKNTAPVKEEDAAPKDKADTKTQNVGGGVKVASFDTVEELFDFIEKGGFDHSPIRPTD
jgi:hypothetical protein